MGAVTAAREIAPCPTDTRADIDAECDMDDSPYNHMDIYKHQTIWRDLYCDAFGNIVAHTDSEGNLVVTNPNYNKYFYTDSNDSGGTQPDADAPVKRSERGGLGENDQNT